MPECVASCFAAGSIQDRSSTKNCPVPSLQGATLVPAGMVMSYRLLPMAGCSGPKTIFISCLVFKVALLVSLYFGASAGDILGLGQRFVAASPVAEPDRQRRVG